MRASNPDIEGRVERGGVSLAYEVHGDANSPSILFLPTWSIVHSRVWKGQVPYLSRHFRVITFDGRGCGQSDRPAGAVAYNDAEYAADAVAVLDATDTPQATVVALSSGSTWAIQLAGLHPERVTGIVTVGSRAGTDPAFVEMESGVFTAELDEHEGWLSYNREHWLNGGYEQFIQFFFREMHPEPHSTKQIEDCVGWARDIGP